MKRILNSRNHNHLQIIKNSQINYFNNIPVIYSKNYFINKNTSKTFTEYTQKPNNEPKQTIKFEQLNNTNNKYFNNIYETYQGDMTYHELHENKFDLFLDKMQKLFEKENKRRERNKTYANELRNLSLNSKEPLREILIHYQYYRNENGFDAEGVSETIYVLGKTYSARTRFHKSYTDLTHWELINSTRLFSLVQDIQFAIVNSLSFLNGNQLKKIIEGLKLANYKNTALVTLIQQKLSSIIFKDLKDVDEKYSRFSDMPGVGKKDFLNINPNAEDILLDKNIDIFLQKLMKLNFEENSEKKIDFTLNKSSENPNESSANDEKYIELENNIKNIIGLMQETKDLQFNFTDNINNLVDQYFKMEQLMIDNPEIRENPYTKYSLNKIQDKFIEMGFIDIDTFKAINSRKLTPEEFSKLKSETVIKILGDYIFVNFPDVFSSLINDIESTQEVVEENFKLNLTKNRVSHENLGECLNELSEYSKITNIDVNSEDYESKAFNLDYYNKEIPEKPVEFIRTKPEYTKLYNNSLNFFKSIKKELLKKYRGLENFKYHCNLILSYANLNLLNKDLYETSIKNCFIILNNEKEKISNEDIVKLLYGSAISGFEINISILKTALKRFDFQHIDLSLDFTLKMIWALLSYESKIDDKFMELIYHLNSFEIFNNLTEDVKYYLNVDLFYEITIALKEYSKKYKIENKNISNLIYLSNKYFDNKSALLQRQDLDLRDPLKDNMKRIFLEKFFKDKSDYSSLFETNQNILGFQSLIIPFNPDFILDIYGNKVCIFTNSIDKDFKYNYINGHQRLIRNILEKFYNCTCIFIPISKFINFDPSSLRIEFNESSGLENFDKLLFSSICFKKPKLNEGLRNLQKFNQHFKKFISNIVNGDNPEFDLIQNTENKEQLEIFFKNLLYATEVEKKLIYNCSFSQFNLTLLEFRKILNVMDLVSESLSENFKKYLVKNLSFEEKTYMSLKEFLVGILKEYEKYFGLLKETNKCSDIQSLNDNNWIGKRLNVDLINTELLSNNILEDLKKKKYFS